MKYFLLIVVVLMGCPKDDPISSTAKNNSVFVDSLESKDTTCLEKNGCYFVPDSDPEPPKPPKDSTWKLFLK